MDILLNDNQKMAIKKAIKWYFCESTYKKLLTISGCAGVGKTFLAKIIIQSIGLQPYQVIFATPTGKAAEVLRRNYVSATTIHKIFYTVRKIGNKLKFSKKRRLPSTIKLIVLDELSMINDRMINDILSFNVPIIGLGDSYQLPPIYGSNKYLDEPDILLTEIMRQKKDIGVLSLATMARNGKAIPFGDYIESKVIRIKDIDNIEKYDIILCWKNITRQNLNITIRNKLGFTSDYPTIGEKLICLKNNYTHLLEYNETPILLVNGMDLLAHSTVKLKNNDICDHFSMSYVPTYIKDAVFTTRVHRGPFDSYKYGVNYIITGDEDADIVFLDFGYACTVHKSQGSEFNDVLIIDEFKGSDEIYNKWLYTAITRARKSVTIARYF
jgi:exodeoxyribonuclease-5